jgi:hypothetical protein
MATVLPSLTSNESKIMHPELLSPVLAGIVSSPVGGIFLVILTVLAVLRGKI